MRVFGLGDETGDGIHLRRGYGWMIRLRQGFRLRADASAGRVGGMKQKRSPGGPPEMFDLRRQRLGDGRRLVRAGLALSGQPATGGVRGLTRNWMRVDG